MNNEEKENFNSTYRKLDKILTQLEENHRYNQRTALLVIVLWGIGLPLVVVGNLLFVAWNF